MKPEIIIPSFGVNNADLAAAAARVEKGSGYKDLSTIIITPTRGGNSLSAKWTQSQISLMKPMNQKVYDRIWMSGMEVGDAYNAAIEMILGNEELSKWKYILTVEDDVIPPPDGLVRLCQSMTTSKRYAAIGGIYWTKGPGGQPMIYGDPTVYPLNCAPQLPRTDGGLQECNGMGMGFHLFKLDIFKNKDLPKPWFKTVQEFTPGVGGRAFTQDLYFYTNAAKAGYRFACDTSVKCGHYDTVEDMTW